MKRKEQIKIEGGWLVNIERDANGYTIKEILAQFGHHVYLHIDMKGLTEEQWDMFHEQVGSKAKEE